MRLLMVLLAGALPGLGVTACGGAGKGGSSSNASSDVVASSRSPNGAAPQTTGSASPPSLSESGPARHYLNDGDQDGIGDEDGDNSHDNDKDAYLDYKPDESGNYHDGDDDLAVTYGHAADAAETRTVTVAVERYYRTAVAGEAAAACRQLGSGLAGSVAITYGRFGAAYLHGGKTCPQVMARLFRHLHGQLVRPLRVTDVRIQGESALALFGSSTMPASEITLMREGGIWKIARIIGSPLP